MSTFIGFSTSKTSLVSRIIRWFTNSTVSHTFIVYYDDEWKRYMVMESEGGMGGSVRIVRFNPNSSSIVKLIEPKHSIELGMQKMVDNLGEVYDYKGLFGMAWVELGKWLRKKWINPWQSPNSMFCSELVMKVLQDSKYPGADKYDAGSTDPQMLMDFLEEKEPEL